ncbi:MAG TPA: helix-turn-helix transcriptional regulator [Actinomycetota bacterium]|nr:helix-turn-helix transcriptional regulator [Actinomycetota bacterium]
MVKERKWADNGKAMARARRRAGVSQENLAAQVGITRRHMIRLENGEHLPSGELRDRIAGAVGVDVDEIQSADDDEEESPLAMTTDDLLRELFVRLGARRRVNERRAW